MIRSERVFELRVSQSEMSEMLKVIHEYRKGDSVGAYAYQSVVDANADMMIHAALCVLSGIADFPASVPFVRDVYNLVVVSPPAILDEIKRIKRLK